MTGPARSLLTRSTMRTGQPVPDGRPDCWRDQAADDGQACALAYTPGMQADLLEKSPGCCGCVAGVNAAALFYQLKRRQP